MNKPFSESLLRRLCRELERRIRTGERELAEQYFSELPDLERDYDAAIDLIYCEYLALEAAGERPSLDDLRQRFPDWFERISKLLEVHGAIADDLAEDELTHAGEFIESRIGKTIGDYKLLQEIGEGGFGVVYMAQQLRPVRRQVALKVIKPGMDTREALARFESERQALALMDHPNICRVLEAGATEGGYPYFVMELVKGVPITEYCRKQKIPIRDRLELFRTVCSAVQHAHTKGVIHRDLKPSNVMITFHDTVAVPKVIDFGIAKALNQQLTEKTLFTKYGQLLGTPMYMSPEQAELSGLDIDIRSDVYALGVLLYELLTGSTPFKSERFESATYADLVRMITEEDPPTPSTRIHYDSQSEGIAGLGIQVQGLSRELKGDLDRIVMKAMEKDRRRRYETVNDLSRDIRNFLNDEPISAGSVNSWSRVRRLIRRHKVTVAASGFVLAALVIGFVVSTIGLIQASRATQRERLARLDEQSQRHRAETEEVKKTLALKREQAHREKLENSLYRHRIAAVQQSLQTKTSTDSVRELMSCPPSLRGWEWGYLLREATRGIVVLDEHELSVSRVAFSPDGRWIVSGSSQWNSQQVGKAVLTNARTLKTERILYQSHGGVYDVAFSPDSKSVALSNGNGGGVQVVDVETGATVLQAEQGRRVYAVAYNNDGSLLAVGGTGKRLVVLDSATGTTLKRFEIESVFDCSFSPDSKWLAAVSHSGITRVWDMATGELIQELEETGNRSVEFSPDGSLLASCGYDGKEWGVLNVFEKFDNKFERRYRQVTNFGSVTQLSFSPDGKQIALSGFGGKIRLFDSMTGRQTLERPAHDVRTNCIRFCERSQRIVSCGNADIKVWKQELFQTPTRSRSDRSYLTAFVFFDGGRQIALAGGRNRAQSMFSLQEHPNANSVQVFPVGEDQDIEFAPAIELVGATSWLTSLTLSPSEQSLAAGSDDGTVSVWDLREFKHTLQLKTDHKAIRKLYFVDETSLLSLGQDGDLRLWDLADGQPISKFADYKVHDIASYKGSQFVALTRSGRLELFDVRKHRDAQLIASETTARQVTCSASSSRVATAGSQDGVRIYGVSGLNVKHEPRVVSIELGEIHRLKFNRAGDRLAVYAQDGTVTIVDAASSNEVLGLNSLGQSNHLLDLQFSPGGRHLAVSRGTELTIWSAHSKAMQTPWSLRSSLDFENRAAGD